MHAVLIGVLVQAYIAVFSFLNGDAKRLIYGYDSFGNTCNQRHNSRIKNLSLSGRDTSGMPLVSYYYFLFSFSGQVYNVDFVL